METILTESEAEDILNELSKTEKAEIERDKIRFGEYFIVSFNNSYYRVNPINVIVKNGVPEMIKSTSLTFI